jgi:hypothetical protein
MSSVGSAYIVTNTVRNSIGFFKGVSTYAVSGQTTNKQSNQTNI